MGRRIKRFISLMVVGAMTFGTISGSVDVSAITGEKENKSVEYEIYPNPHEVNYSGGEFEVGTDVNVVYENGIDVYTKNRVEQILNSKNINLSISNKIVEGKTNILIGINGSGEGVDTYFNENVSHQENFFEKLDSNIVYVKNGVIGVLGNNTDSTFYGVTSLKHVFNQLENGMIKNFRINDYADVKYRGFIEGYYGNPWSNEDRAELMKYGGEYKMNQYIFAPKDDPYHNSKWRELYPADALEGVKKLAQVGNETKNRYVYALHPFMHNAIRFNTEENYQADLQIIKNKFSQLLGAGVRQFGILADDAGVPAQGAQTYVKLLNDLTLWLEEQKETYTDLKTDLIFCPNDYMGNGGSAQLKEINKAGDNVSIVVTGGRIWGEVDQNFATNFKNNIASEGHEGRAPYMWINWPCSDNSKQHLIMGGNDTFLHPGVTPGSVQGIVLNPMQQAEANKSALFANADYAWNIWETKAEADKNWEASFKYMDHGTAEDTDSSKALREISKHMINQNMDGRVTALQESVELAPKLTAYKQKFESETNTKADAEELIAEFTKLKEAASYYKENPGNSRARDQIIYWLNCWEDTMNAAIGYLRATMAIEDGNNDEIWTEYSNAKAALEQSKTYTFWYVDHYERAEVGVQHIVPFINFMEQNVGNIVSSIIDPNKVIATYITNRTDKPSGDIKNVLDGNPATEIVYKTPNTISEGTYVGVKYSNPIQLKNVQFLMGAAANPNDTMSEAKIQYTEDGKVWTDLNEEVYTNPKDVKVEGLDLTVKGIRIIATRNKGNTWLGVKDIVVNKEEGNGGTNESPLTHTLIRTAGWSIYGGGNESALFDNNDSTSVWYKTHAEDLTHVGDYIGVDLGEIVEVGNVHFVVGAGDSDKWTEYKLEYSTDNSTWTTFKEYNSTAGKDIINENLHGAQARYVRLTNMRELNKWVKFSEIRIERVRNEEIGDTKNIYTNVDSGIKSISTDSLTKLIPQNNITLNAGEYIGVKLNRIKNISRVTANISNMDGLRLESSMNEIEWNAVDTSNLKDARYIRLIADKTVTFNVSAFEVESNEVYPPSLVSSYVEPHNGANPKLALDGNFNTSVKFGGPPRTDSTIVYDLGQTRNINNIKYAVLDTEVDHIRDAKIQVSLNGEEWTDAIVIGDGVENTNNFDAKPGENGYKHGSVSNGIIPISHSYVECENLDLQARYLRVLFTAANSGRWSVINEILINNGEYVRTENNPTYTSNPIELKGFEPGKVSDGNLATAYKPNTNNGAITSGSFTYRLSEKTDIKKINIVQSGSSISNAKVMVRTGYNEAGEPVWNELGTLDKSLTELLNPKFENIFEIRIDWEGVAPTIYEIITINNYELPNSDELKSKFDELSLLNGDNYTAESFKVLEDALKIAEVVLNNNNALQSEIDEALAGLIAAEEGLVLNIVDGSGLQELVDSCNFVEDRYTVSSWVVYSEALNSAKEILADLQNTTQAAVDEAKVNLEKSIEGLKERATFTLGLEIAVDEANKITDEEIDKLIPVVKDLFLKERAKSIEVLERAKNKDATQEEVNDAFDSLSKAMQYLSFYKGDKTSLIALVDRISKLDSKEYIKSTWDKLVIELEKANVVIADENALEYEVAEAYEDLMKAFLDLRLKPSKEKLEDLINKTESLEKSNYTESTWRVVDEKLQLAKKVMDNEDAIKEEILEVYKELEIAVNNLVDIQELKKAIEEGEKINLDGYTKDSANALLSAMEAGKKVLENSSATKEEIQAAIKAINDANKALVKKADLTSLKEIIEKAKEVINGEDKYTSESLNALKEDLENAEKLIENENVTDEDVQKAIDNIIKAIEALKEKEQGSTGQPGNGEGQGSSGGGKPSGNSSGNLPNAGGTPAVAVALMGLLAIGAGSCLRKKNK